jgi:hypothetical protein
LQRHASAAYLNALHPGVAYLYSPSEVLDMYAAAVSSGDYDTTKNLFQEQNEKGCPLSATYG